MTPLAGVFVVATARTQVADFLAALILVYTIVLIAWAVMEMAAQLGYRLPYSTASDQFTTFLRQTAEPYVRLFKFVPPLGPLDLSFLVAILVLQFGGGFVVSIIHG